MSENQDHTHFGYQDVPLTEKANLVAQVFDRVAPKYDLMNDVMSAGMHRLWKRITVERAQIKPHYVICDLAGGTGDLSYLMAKKLDNTGNIYITDINHSMLTVGRSRLIDYNFFKNISYIQADAEHLPYPKQFFHVITMAFGLRNVTQKSAALKQMVQTLKPGGQCLILEFSKPFLPILKTFYDQYSFKLIPKLGELIANDKESYQYLVESIRKHPNQEVLKTMMLDAGFDEVKIENFAGGIVALHRGFKY